MNHTLLEERFQNILRPSMPSAAGPNNEGPPNANRVQEGRVCHRPWYKEFHFSFTILVLVTIAIVNFRSIVDWTVGFMNPTINFKSESCSSFEDVSSEEEFAEDIDPLTPEEMQDPYFQRLLL